MAYGLKACSCHPLKHPFDSWWANLLLLDWYSVDYIWEPLSKIVSSSTRNKIWKIFVLCMVDMFAEKIRKRKHDALGIAFRMISAKGTFFVLPFHRLMFFLPVSGWGSIGVFSVWSTVAISIIEYGILSEVLRERLGLEVKLSRGWNKNLSLPPKSLFCKAGGGIWNEYVYALRVPLPKWLPGPSLLLK